MSVDALVATSTAVFAFSTYAAGRWPSFSALSLTLPLAGIAWIQILASLNVAAQTMCPHHMRARAISMYLLVLQGGFALGAALWGAVAERVGVEQSMEYAAIGLIVGITATIWFRLHPVPVEELDLSLAIHPEIASLLLASEWARARNFAESYRGEFA